MSVFEAAFNDAPEILSQVADAAQNAALEPLLSGISYHVVNLKREIHDLKRKLEDQNTTAEEPATKKRKLPLGGPPDASPGNTTWHTAKATFEVADISFSIPVRKKLSLELVSGDDATQSGIKMPAPSGTEQGVAISWSDIEQVICVPVPEKAQKAYQFVVIPCTSPTSSHNPDSLMWTISSAPPKDNQVTIRDPATGAESHAANPELTLDLMVLQTINTNLQRISKSITLPSPNEFASALVQPHLKSQTERAYHVKAFRGSKDGFLYFLPTGILFTPRKPLLFFPFSQISSISYSSVLQRTFNLNISARVSPSGSHADAEPEDAEFEFAMLDQADFAGIDAYVKRHGLHDASLAESRRAKVYNVNAAKGAAGAAAATAANGAVNGAGEDAAGADGGQDRAVEGETELARAERELQDAEDDEEEDYDPSGGESEGSGSDSEDGDDPAQYAEDEEVEAEEEQNDVDDENEDGDE